MLQKICKWLLFKQLGWKTNITVNHPDKFIIALAPHTSNWDFIVGQLYMRSQNMNINFLMKKEWFFWPLGILLRHMGGIPVYRSKHTSMTDHLAQEAKDRRHSITKCRMEERLLLHCSESTDSRSALWRGLRAKAYSVY